MIIESVWILISHQSENSWNKAIWGWFPSIIIIPEYSRDLEALPPKGGWTVQLSGGGTTWPLGHITTLHRNDFHPWRSDGKSWDDLAVQNWSLPSFKQKARKSYRKATTGNIFFMWFKHWSASTSLKIPTFCDDNNSHMLSYVLICSHPHHHHHHHHLTRNRGFCW